jgi:hypothetical protein
MIRYYPFLNIGEAENHLLKRSSDHIALSIKPVVLFDNILFDIISCSLNYFIIFNKIIPVNFVTKSFVLCMVLNVNILVDPVPMIS